MEPTAAQVTGSTTTREWYGFHGYQNNPSFSHAERRWKFYVHFWTPAFYNRSIYGIKNYGVDITFNGMACVHNFMKIYPLVQKLLVGDTGGQTASSYRKVHFPFFLRKVG